MPQESMTRPPNAVNSLIKLICRYHRARAHRRRKARRSAAPLQSLWVD